MQVLRAADHKRMPWKNGGGETVEIAVFPPGAGLDEFDWRISTATVAADGPFSSFAGVDRTLSILSGAGLMLSIEDRAPVTLDRNSPPCSFSADKPTSARLLGGAITDLNVMTRRGRYTHHVRRLEIPCGITPSPDIRLVLCNQGKLRVSTSASELTLDALDCLILVPHEWGQAALSGQAEAFLIELRANQAVV
ncbi:HutD family protein [Rhizobium sp. LCM 4573]|uniref:HutD/Ves family protein n=1 Tax=Rhizobium sp. LCM 4573 TaxID=1848291 RepID=UPI0008DA1B37|nr:HutD family protein [Rhizobium sp. LCM 4573]OHV76889.1 HutD-family protein [Rhizobium sp. LCM 4573]